MSKPAATSRRVRAFTRFARRAAPKLKQALIAHLGGDVGEEATAEALAWGWQHWDELSAMQNPAGYLYRVGMSRGMRQLGNRLPVYPDPPARTGNPDPWIEPALPSALARLSPQQRAAVMLIHGFGWTYGEVAKQLEISKGTVQEHVQRGMEKLRTDLKVDADA